jgi:DNA polymerase-3 subunit beta
MAELERLLGDSGEETQVQFAKDENHLFFSLGSRRLVSRVLAGQFPNYELVIPRDNDKNIVASARNLGDGIRRAAIMSDEKLKAEEEKLMENWWLG